MSECVEWSKGVSGSGYGAVSWGGNQHGVHRFVYELYHGELAEGLVVRHTCDNKLCYNLDHLVAGTHADNVQDKMSKGRWKGSYVRKEYNMVEMKRLNDSGVGTRRLGKYFGCGRSTVMNRLKEYNLSTLK